MSKIFALTALAVAIATWTAQGAVAAPATAPAVHLSGLHATATVSRFIVTYRTNTLARMSPTAMLPGIGAAANKALGASSAARPVSFSYVRRLSVGGDVVRSSRKLSGTEATAVMKQIATDPNVLRVEPDLMMHAIRDAKAATTLASFGGAPDDEFYASYQWDYFDPRGGVNRPALWEAMPAVDGHGVTVAVIDTGITDHDDLDTSLAASGYDFISDAFVSGRDTDARIPGGWDLGDWTNAQPYLSECGDPATGGEASSWHGTNVAGVIGELTNNSRGMAGMAAGAKVLPIRALGHCGGYTSDIADAIIWAAGGHVDGVPDNTHPAQVINMSLGGSGSCTADDTTGSAVAQAIALGASVVVAAGNSGDDTADYSPSSCPGVIAVAATGATGKRAFYSNYGSKVALAAPGGGIYVNDASSGSQDVPNGFIWAALNAGTTTPVNIADGGAVYAGMAGTSQATPHVAATLALMIGALADLGTPQTPAQLREALLSSTRAFPTTQPLPIGAGMLDSHAAVLTVLGMAPPQSVTSLVRGQLVTGQYIAAGRTALFSLDVPVGAKSLTLRTLGGTGDIKLYAKFGAEPAADGSDAELTSSHPGNAESVIVASPRAGTYYIRLIGVTDAGNISIIGNFVTP